METVEGHNLGFEALAKVNGVYSDRDRDMANPLSRRYWKFATNPESKLSLCTLSASKTSSDLNMKSTG